MMSLTKVSYSLITGAPVNVMDFGATGDGLTDDTAAIQAAIDSLSNDTGTKTGGIIYFPIGNYLIDSGPLTIYDSIILVGNAGHMGEWQSVPVVKGTTLTNNNNGNTIECHNNGTASLNSKISYINFNGSGTGSHIYMPSANSEVRISNCAFRNKEHGINLQGGVGSPTTFIEIDHNSFEGQTAASLLINDYEGYAWEIYKNHFRDGDAEAIKATTGFFLEGLNIYNNHIDGYTANNINVIDLQASNSNIFSNWFFCANGGNTNTNSFAIRIADGHGVNIWGNTLSCGNGIKLQATSQSFIGVNTVGVYVGGQLINVNSSSINNVILNQGRPPSQPSVGSYAIVAPQNYITTKDYGAAQISVSVAAADSPYSLNPNVRFVYCNAAAGPITINLFSAQNISEGNGLEITFIKIDSSANAITIQGTGGQLINGSASTSLAAQYNKVKLVALLGAWFISG